MAGAGAIEDTAGEKQKLGGMVPTSLLNTSKYSNPGVSISSYPYLENT